MSSQIYDAPAPRSAAADEPLLRQVRERLTEDEVRLTAAALYSVADAVENIVDDLHYALKDVEGIASGIRDSLSVDVETLAAKLDSLNPKQVREVRKSVAVLVREPFDQTVGRYGIKTAALRRVGLVEAAGTPHWGYCQLSLTNGIVEIPLLDDPASMTFDSESLDQRNTISELVKVGRDFLERIRENVPQEETAAARRLDLAYKVSLLGGGRWFKVVERSIGRRALIMRIDRESFIYELREDPDDPLSLRGINAPW